MNIVTPSGETVIVYPLIEHEVISNLAHNLVIHEGAIRLDTANHTLDDAHLVLDGVLTAGQDYFKILKSNEKLLNADHTGKLFCHKGVAAPEITALTTDVATLQASELVQTTNITSNTQGIAQTTPQIVALQTSVGTNQSNITTIQTNVGNNQSNITTIQTSVSSLQTSDVSQNTTISAIETALANSTHQNTHDTIVKRDNNSTTSFHDITTNILSANQAIALYGDATLQYVPQDENGQNMPDFKFRFGHNSDEIGDLSASQVGAGLEMKDPDDNEILIQVNPKTPHIEIKTKKDAGVPWILARDHFNTPIWELDAAGISQHCDALPSFGFTPGLKYVSELGLVPGFQAHRYELSAAWTPDISESIIELSMDVSPGVYHHIENLEVTLDDLAVVAGLADIPSRLYLKRWGVYRNSRQRLYIVIAVDFAPNAIEIEIGSKIRITFNNKRVLNLQ